MTEQEKKLVNSGDADAPMRVLLTTDEADSLFLRQQSEDVDVVGIGLNRDLKKLIERMKATLAQEEGAGLAAAQVGIARNIFLFVRVNDPDMPVQVAINPKIMKHPEEQICFEGDGCLSIPDESGASMRYPWVEVEYYDQNGKCIRETLSGGSRETDYTGIIFQHEYDHLQGVLFTDRLCER